MAQLIGIETKRDRVLDALKTDHVLKVEYDGHRGTPLSKRFGIGMVPAGCEGRQVDFGPVVPGPWAYTFGLGTCICSNPGMGTHAESQRKLAAKTEHVVEDGDVLAMGGAIFTVKIKSSGNGVRMELELQTA